MAQPPAHPIIRVHGLKNRFGSQWVHRDLDMEVAVRIHRIGVLDGFLVGTDFDWRARWNGVCKF